VPKPGVCACVCGATSTKECTPQGRTRRRLRCAAAWRHSPRRLCQVIARRCLDRCAPGKSCAGAMHRLWRARPRSAATLAPHGCSPRPSMPEPERPALQSRSSMVSSSSLIANVLCTTCYFTRKAKDSSNSEVTTPAENDCQVGLDRKSILGWRQRDIGRKWFHIKHILICIVNASELKIESGFFRNAGFQGTIFRVCYICLVIPRLDHAGSISGCFS
jgi:hypothetical protein